MSNFKNKITEYLLREIGEIDDAIIAEAEAYKAKKTNAYKPLLIAAAFTLAFALVIGSALISRMRPFVNDNSEHSNYESNLQTVEQLFSENTYQNLFSSTYVMSDEDLPYFNQGVHIVWQNVSEIGYCVSDRLTLSEFERLNEQMGIGEQTGTDSPNLQYKVWVLYGDGRVTSPYLKRTNGNISGEIFDYEAEIIPTENFARLLLELLQ